MRIECMSMSNEGLSSITINDRNWHRAQPGYSRHERPGHQSRIGRDSNTYKVSCCLDFPMVSNNRVQARKDWSVAQFAVWTGH